jgi:ribosomal protein L22
MTPPDKMSPPPEGGWESLKVDELKTELEARGLPKSGNKAELIERLLDDDAGQAVTDAAPAAEKEAAVSEVAGEPATEDPSPEDAEQITSGETAEADVPEADTPEADADEADEAGEPEAKKPRRRRGSAETSAPAQSRKRASRPEGDLVVRARARYVRSAPRKARLVMDHIRGKRVEHAQAILEHAPRAISSDILKLLNSAIANAESAYELGADELTIRRAYVDEGPTIKRYRPRALGRATPIHKRTSHMTIELTTDGNGR